MRAITHPLLRPFPPPPPSTVRVSLPLAAYYRVMNMKYSRTSRVIATATLSRHQDAPRVISLYTNRFHNWFCRSPIARPTPEKGPLSRSTAVSIRRNRRVHPVENRKSRTDAAARAPGSRIERGRRMRKYMNMCKKYPARASGTYAVTENLIRGESNIKPRGGITFNICPVSWRASKLFT
ncbi:hypothetical protein EVAR_26890_1 [Eumeta japonica]|uniref:Uncharacterized protein n=1 Tax=Eumeta variegata TaxID=151549 RepID=A0A4C1VRP4_EUMVA|nr:hypothetical protein EVAR_26890_1 [Eumeta japonica]